MLKGVNNRRNSTKRNRSW